MDRKRNRKNAKGSKVIKFVSLILGASLLYSCSNLRHQVVTRNKPPTTHQGNIPKRSELTMQQRFSGVLDFHNRARYRHNLRPLKWSNKLAQYSQEWANHLARNRQCQMYHRSGNSPYGENLYISSAEVWREGSGREVARQIYPVTIKDVVGAWAGEEKWFNYQQNRCQPGQKCGHYTQIVWRDTTEVGCAMKVCADKSQTWVCSYNPPGNFVGSRPY